MSRATVHLCQPAASRRSVDCVELTVLRLYDCEDAFGVASCCYLLVELDLLSGWPATVAGVAARGWAIRSPDLAVRRRQHSVPMRWPIVPCLVTPRSTILLTRREALPIAPRLAAPFVSSA
jgi:hypothetical protein